MNTFENTTSKIKSEIEKNEKSLGGDLDVSHPINMKKFWNNIDSMGFNSQSQIYNTRHYIELYSQFDANRDINFSKSGFPRNFSSFLSKYQEKYTKKDNLELVEKLCGFNLILENNNFLKQNNNNSEIENEIAFLEKIISEIEIMNYNNSIKIKKFFNKEKKKILETKQKIGLYTPESILTKEEIHQNLIDQIYNLQMKQFAECICGVQYKKINDESKYKIIFEKNENIPILELTEKEYRNFIKYRDPLNSISVYDLFQEKTHSYYNTDKVSSKYNKINLEEIIEKGISFEKNSKNSKIELKTNKYLSQLHNKKQKKINTLIINNNISQNELEKINDYQIGKKTKIEYFYCHHCKQRKPAEFSIKCKSSLTELKFCQRPFKTFVINGTTIIRSK